MHTRHGPIMLFKFFPIMPQLFSVQKLVDNSETSESVDNSISLTISIDNIYRGCIKSMLYPWR